MGLWFLWLYGQEHLKTQPTVVLVLMCLRRRGNGLKSHPTDWEKSGIEPETRGLQDIGLSPTPRPLIKYWTVKVKHMNSSTTSPRARNRFNQVAEAKRFEDVVLCRKVR